MGNTKPMKFTLNLFHWLPLRSENLRTHSTQDLKSKNPSGWGLNLLHILWQRQKKFGPPDFFGLQPPWVLSSMTKSKGFLELKPKTHMEGHMEAPILIWGFCPLWQFPCLFPSLLLELHIRGKCSMLLFFTEVFKVTPSLSERSFPAVWPLISHCFSS